MDTKTAVEERLALDVNELAGHGSLQVAAQGSVCWEGNHWDEVAASIQYSTALSEDGNRVFLMPYSLEDQERLWGASSESVNHRARPEPWWKGATAHPT